MTNRRYLISGLAGLALAAITGSAMAQDTVKVGLILPMTGPFASIGKQVDMGARLFLAQNGSSFGGKKIELILKDDTGSADVTRRIAQELVVNDKVAVLAGFGLTPLALAAAQVSTQAKVPQIVMAAATATITEASPFIVRSSFTLPQASEPMADWALKNNIKRVFTVVTDYGPGIDAETSFANKFKAGGGVVESVRVPLRNPDFAPFLQRAADAKPDALFVFVPAGIGAQFMKQYVERGLDKAGTKLIGPGDVVDDDLLEGIGDVAIGAITTQHYSAAHESAANKAFVTAFKAAYPGTRPNFMAVGGYDGMRLIAEALKKTNGTIEGEALVTAMKGMNFESPRGPILIDPETRDIVQNIYIRRTERKNGEIYNIEFDTIPMVKDPVKAAKK
ncbi:ABC transporter substrate-binding protein [Rhizobiales bacterium TNE-4]|nr:ABC transporter substrate-binding protein [Rhizobiales bacterium TNE-4]MBV1827523.1 ABC transporter substrate-binding protein [Rhizobiales bacterium TNE-4]